MPKEPDPNENQHHRHFTESTYREMIVETAFLGELLRYLWSINAPVAEVLHTMRDNAGYDVVIECNSVLRYIQLKGMISRKGVRVNVRLAKKRGACVIGIIFDPSNLQFGDFLWFGESGGEAAPNFDQCPAARALHYNRNGEHPVLKDTKIIRSKDFDVVSSIALLAEKLFGVNGGHGQQR